MKDKKDACPYDKTMSVVDFRKHVVFRPDGEAISEATSWKVENQGREVRKNENEDSIFIG